MKSCLLVIPSFRDARRLRPFLDELLGVLTEGFSVLAVDDGSGRAHAEELCRVVNEARAKTPAATLLDPLLMPRNMGKGAAVYAGWRSGPACDVLGFIDADGAVPARELLRIWEAWPSLDADAVIASRVKMLGRSVERLPMRHYSGRVFATLASQVTGLAVYDSQCGCKLVRRSAFMQADRRGLTASRLAFDVELLVALSQSDCRIVEFPVDWRDVAGGSVSVVKHALPMVLELIRIRRRLGRVCS